MKIDITKEEWEFIRRMTNRVLILYKRGTFKENMKDLVRDQAKAESLLKKLGKDYQNEEAKCFFCHKELDTRKRVNYNNSSIPAFVFMPENESCHLECYHEEIIKKYMEKLHQ